MWSLFRSSACVAIHPRLCGLSPQVRSAAATPKSILLSTWGFILLFMKLSFPKSCKFALWCVGDGILQQTKKTALDSGSNQKSYGILGSEDSSFEPRY